MAHSPPTLVPLSRIYLGAPQAYGFPLQGWLCSRGGRGLPEQVSRNSAGTSRGPRGPDPEPGSANPLGLLGTSEDGLGGEEAEGLSRWGWGQVRGKLLGGSSCAPGPPRQDQQA